MLQVITRGKVKCAGGFDYYLDDGSNDFWKLGAWAHQWLDMEISVEVDKPLDGILLEEIEFSAQKMTKVWCWQIECAYNNSGLCTKDEIRLDTEVGWEHHCADFVSAWDEPPLDEEEEKDEQI